MRIISLILVLLFLSGCSHQAAKDKKMITLDDYHWHLIGINARLVTPVEGLTQLDFASDRIIISGLCNSISGSVMFNGNQLRIGQLVGTLKACVEVGLMAHEQAFSDWLVKVNTWSIEVYPQEPILTLSQPSGEFIRLRGEPTPEKRYGSNGDIIFLEIQPKKVTCNHPLIPHYQCLSVRTVAYNDQGIKTLVGEWQNFYDQIQRYDHREDIRVILRVKRYPITNAPADSSSFAYIHDLTVEQERVAP